MSDDTTTYVETTTTTTEHTIPVPDDPPLMEVDPSMSQQILDRLDALDRRIDDMAPTVIVEETTVEESEPVEDEPVTDEPDSDDPTDEPLTTDAPNVDEPNTLPAPEDTPPVVPDPDKPYSDRPEIEGEPYTPDAKAKKKKRDRTPSTPRSWRTAVLGGSGGIRTGGSK